MSFLIRKIAGKQRGRSASAWFIAVRRLPEGVWHLLVRAMTSAMQISIVAGEAMPDTLGVGPAHRR